MPIPTNKPKPTKKMGAPSLIAKYKKLNYPDNMIQIINDLVSKSKGHKYIHETELIILGSLTQLGWIEFKNDKSPDVLRAKWLFAKCNEDAIIARATIASGGDNIIKSTFYNEAMEKRNNFNKPTIDFKGAKDTVFEKK